MDQYYGETALLRAAMNGDADRVNYLLAHNAFVEEAMDNWGARKGHRAAVNALLAHNAYVDAKNSDGETALMLAAMNGHTDAVDALLAHNANMELEGIYDDGQTALMLAAEKGHVAIVDTLLAHNAYVDATHWDGRTALGYAVRNRDNDYIPCVSALLRRGASIDVTDSDQLEGLLWCSVKSADVYGLVKARLENEDVLDAFIQVSCRRGTDRFTTLLNMGVLSFDREDKDGDSPLTLAAANSNTGLVSHLLEKGADANRVNKFGQSCYSFAVANKDSDLVALLNSRGVTVLEDKNDYPMWGMRLADLEEFAIEVGRATLEGLTTYDVQLIVKEKTVDKMCSYCERFEKKTPANVFISHAWGYLFLDLVDAIMAHLKTSDADVVVWLDVFSVNQHPVTEEKLPFSFWSTVFKMAIVRIGWVVMILCSAKDHIWNDPLPLPLLRAWCLFESYCAISGGCKFEVSLSARDKAAFRAALSEDAGVLYALIDKIDVTKAKAKEPEDLRLIKKSIQKYQGGAESMNELLRECVKEGYEA